MATCSHSQIVGGMCVTCGPRVSNPAHVQFVLLNDCKHHNIKKASHKRLPQNSRDFFATVNDLALLTIRSTVLKQNGISLIQSYGHFVSSSDKRKRKNEASGEFLGEAKTVLG